MADKMHATEDELMYAGFFIRLLAYFIDLLWVVFIAFVFGALIGASGFYYLSNFSPLDIILQFLIIVIVLLFWEVKQGTPGKLALGMKIVDAETGGKPAFPRYLLRYIGYLPSALLFGFGYLWILWHPKKQSWHDLMARTVVVRSLRSQTQPVRFSSK